MKAAFYLFILIALFNSFSEPHEIKIRLQVYKNGKTVAVDYGTQFTHINHTKTSFTLPNNKTVIPDSIVYTCTSN